MARRCKTGIPKNAERAAIRDFDSAEGTLLMAVTTYVAGLPRYPEPNTPEYYACMAKWYAAWQQANTMDTIGRQISSLQDYLAQIESQIAQLQGQLNSGEPILDALVGAFTDCMEGAQA